MPLFGPPDVQKLKAKKNVEGLIKALRYEKDNTIRAAAAEALGQIGDPRAVEPLIAALKDESLTVRTDAAEALGEIDEPRAVEPLIAALKDWEKGSPAAAARALGKIGDARAVGPLVAALKDKNEVVREAAAAALGNIGDPAVKPLIAALKYLDWKGRGHAAAALGKIGDPAVEPLIAALRDENPSVRTSAVEALDHMGWKPDRSEAGGWYWVVKRHWGKCVELGAPAVEPLIEALKDPDHRLRGHAAEALGEIGDPAVEPLIAALQDNSRYVREAAPAALGKIGDARAVEPLITTLNDQGMCEPATAALVKIGDPAVEPLIAALQDESLTVRAQATEALSQLGDGRAVEPLIAALKDSYSKVCEAAAAALGKIGDGRAVEPLVALLQDQDVDRTLREGAATSLVRMHRKAMLDQPAKAVILSQAGEMRKLGRAPVPGHHSDCSWGGCFGDANHSDTDYRGEPGFHADLSP